MHKFVLKTADGWMFPLPGKKLNKAFNKALSKVEERDGHIDCITWDGVSFARVEKDAATT